MKRRDKDVADSVLPRMGRERKGRTGMRRCALAERENYVWVIYMYVSRHIYIIYVVDENNDSAARVQWVSLEIN